MKGTAIKLLEKLQTEDLWGDSFMERIGWYIRWRVIERLSGRDPDSQPHDEGDWKPLFWEMP